jgi:hypothetical protein
MRLGLNLGLGAMRGGGGGGTPPFSPASLFASGEEGAWYDINPAYCFTDTSRTTNAEIGDAVAAVEDRSGNGNHATQTTAAARPILRQTGGGLYYLEFDGVDDGMLTPIIDFTATDKMSVFTAASVASDTSPMFIAELSRSITNADGSFGLVAGTPDADVWRFISKGTAISVANAGNGDLDAPYVVSALSDISGNSVVVRKNAVSGVETTDDQGTGNYTNDSISICSRDMQLTPQYFLDGNLYGLIVRGAASTTEEISNTETYLAAKSGVTL